MCSMFLSKDRQTCVLFLSRLFNSDYSLMMCMWTNFPRDKNYWNYQEVFKLSRSAT